MNGFFHNHGSLPSATPSRGTMTAPLLTPPVLAGADPAMHGAGFAPAIEALAPASLLALPVAQSQGGPPMSVFLLQIAALVAIFYFVVIRPQRKEKQRHQQMLTTLGKGDRVMTNGGILGEIVHATERELTIKTGENTRVVVDRGYVAAKLGGEEDAAAGVRAARLQQPGHGANRATRGRAVLA